MTSAAPTAGSDPRETFWRRNLFGACLAVFAVSFGASVASPLLPSFLKDELGVSEPGQLAFWSGLGGAAGQLMSGLSSPLWGMVADRFGRRLMLARSVIGAGLTTGALGLMQAPIQVILMRGANGIAAGVNPGALSLVAAETPPRHLARSLGILTTLRSLGSTAGPAIGGIAGSLFPLRTVLIAAGAIQLMAFGPVILRIHETSRPPKGVSRPSPRAAIRSLGGATRQAILTVAAAQVLFQFALAGMQQLILIRVIELSPSGGALGSGLAFAAISLSGALVGVFYSGAIPRLGYRRLAIGAALLVSLAAFAAGQATSVPFVIAAAALIGAGQGAHSPTLSSMLGLETPNAVKATIFGASSGAQSLGTAAGATTAGIAGALLGPSGGLHVIAVLALAAPAALALWSREPPVSDDPPAGRSRA